MTSLLFSPFTIKNKTFKNRIGVAPMTRMSAAGDSIPRQDVLAFLKTRAKNGAGLVYTEAIVTDYESAQGYPGQARILNQNPVDAISVSTYDFSRNAFDTGRTMAQLTREVTDLPLLICGKIHARQSAESAMADADLVLSGKSMLLNPDGVADIQAGRDLPLYGSEEAGVAYTATPLP